MNVVLVLPVLIPLAAAALSLLAWRSRVIQRWLALAGAAGLLGAAVVLLAAVARGGIQATQAGAWPAPFGITLVADLFGAIMVLLAAVSGLAVTVYSLGAMDRRRESPRHRVLLGVGQGHDLPRPADRTSAGVLRRRLGRAGELGAEGV